MRITGRQLKQIIREEITRAQGRAQLNEEQTANDAPPAETRRIAQIIGDMLHNPDAFVMDENGVTAFNPKYVLELKRALASSPFWTAVFKGYFGLESLRYKTVGAETAMLDSLNQILQDLRIGPLEQLVPDKESQVAFLRGLCSIYGYDVDTVPGVKQGYEEMLREGRRPRR